MKRVKQGVWMALLWLAVPMGVGAQELPQGGYRPPLFTESRPIWFALNPLTRGRLEVGSPEEWAVLQEEQRRSLHERWARQAGSTLDPLREQLQRRFSRPVKVSLRVGNASVNNWSPFPDRALDARVIRYPMPRSAAYGKPARR